MNLDKIVDSFESKCRESARWDKGDYVKDGLHHCGKCNTPKQVVITLPWSGEERTVYCLCRCEKEKDDAEKAIFEAEQEERRKANQKFNSLQSASYRTMNFENADMNKGNQKYIAMAMSYTAKWETVKQNNTSMIFSGGCGVGKTFVAGCIANELLDRDISVYMATMGDMLAQASNFDTVDEFMQRIVNCDLLIIDDFGAQRETDFAIEKVFEIIDKRVRSRKPMIITTNLLKDDLYNPAGIKQQRIYSRLLEGAAIVEFKGADIRLKNGKNQAQQFLDELLSDPVQQGIF